MRTAGQVILGVLATGGLTKVWESFNATHSVDPTAQVVVGLIMVSVVTWAQSTIEDLTGRGILVPTDREIGDVVLNSGVGLKRMQENRLPAGAVMAMQSRGVMSPIPHP